MAQTKQFGVAYAAAAALDGTETLSVVQDGAMVDTTTQDIADLAGATAPMADSTIKGRAAGAGSGAPQDLTGAQVATITQGAGLDVAATGFRGIPVNDQSGDYTCVAADNGKMIRHPSGAGAGDTYTIPSNASVAFGDGAAISFCNLSSDPVEIAIDTDTLRWSQDGSTGPRMLAQYGMATAFKADDTVWMISGAGLS